METDIKPEEVRDTSRPYGELYLDQKGEAHFICHILGQDFKAAEEDIWKFVELLQRQIKHRSECPYNKDV
jgi:uncharacterized protein (UPF0216 family)